MIGTYSYEAYSFFWPKIEKERCVYIVVGTEKSDGG